MKSQFEIDCLEVQPFKKHLKYSKKRFQKTTLSLLPINRPPEHCANLVVPPRVGVNAAVGEP